MSTSTATLTTSSPMPRRRALRIRLLLATALASVAALVGVSTAAAPAQAAAPASGVISACFKSSYNGTWGPFGGHPVNLDAYVDGRWQVIQTNTLGLNGCLTVRVVAGYHWRMRVYTKYGIWYVGTSKWALVRANYSYNLGTVYL